MRDVSGAVEINVEDLERIERGQELPDEDILLLLVSHYGLQDDDATTLWELAGYDLADAPIGDSPELDDMSEAMIHQPAMMMLALDARILYSDGVFITAGQQGVVLNFTQQAGPQGQSIAIARVGMSQDQARDVLRIFSQNLSPHGASHPARLACSHQAPQSPETFRHQPLASGKEIKSRQMMKLRILRKRTKS